MEGLIEGIIVHFVVSPHNTHRAAIVINVLNKEEGLCELFVFSVPADERGGFFVYTAGHYSDKNLPDTWHWIEKT